MKKFNTLLTPVVYFLLFPIIVITIYEAPLFSSKEGVSNLAEQTICSEMVLQRNNEKRLQIVGLGDSLTKGIGDEKDAGGYIGILEKTLSSNHCSTSIENFSVKGLNSSELLQSFSDDDITEAIKNAHIIVFTIGANDIIDVLKKEQMKLNTSALKKAEKQYETNINHILTELRTLNSDASIYLIGLYNPLTNMFIDDKHLDLLIAKWNNISEKYIDEMNRAYFVPLDDAFPKQIHHYLSDDHFHPNHSGYKLIAKRLFTMMKNEGE